MKPATRWCLNKLADALGTGILVFIGLSTVFVLLYLFGLVVAWVTP